MPLRMFIGKTGERLIVELPAEGDYAEIGVHDSVLDEDFTIRVTYQGARANGYPALSPVVEALPEIEQSCLQQQGAACDAQIRAHNSIIDQLVEQGMNPALAHKLEPSDHRSVIPRIMVGNLLEMILPSGYRDRQYLIGVVTSITIHNQGS